VAEERIKVRQSLVDAYRLGLGPRAAARFSEDELCRDAMIIAARVDTEVDALHRAGGLKSVNASYRDYRLAASARGERVLPYARWLEQYKAGLVREIAANLR
jgi:hypothetical protein